MNPFFLQIQGLYLKNLIDVEVSNGEDDVPRPTASADKLKKLADDDAEEGGVSLAEPIAPNLIDSGVLGQSVPFAAAWVLASFFPLASVGRNVLRLVLGATSHWIR
jgi:hypothetical protein